MKYTLNQQIEVMDCNRWQFQELHRLRQELKQLAQEENDAKWTEQVLTCEANRKIPSLFWQQVRRIRGKEQEKDKGIKDEDNVIRLDPKRKEETLRRHWQEIFKIQPEDNIEFDEGKEQMVNQHIRQHPEEFQEEEK